LAINSQIPEDLIVSWEPVQTINHRKLIHQSNVPITEYSNNALRHQSEIFQLNQQDHNIYYCGALVKLLKRGCTPIMTAQESNFYREIRIFRRFDIHTKIVGWDDKFWYFQHDFYQDEIIRATVLAKGFFVKAKKVVPFDHILAISGHEAVKPPEMSDTLRQWSGVSEKLYGWARETRPQH
jgi:hypothetical protein